jgi:putative ABC transport system substrate-binding protein
MTRLSRRQFMLGAAGTGLLAGCGRLPWQAQPPVRIPRVGFLMPGSPGSIDSDPEPFRQGLAALDYAEGQNLVVEWRLADGDFDRLPALAAELVDRPVDVIVAGGRAIRAAQNATSSIPIVMGFSNADPVADGLIASLARPGANVTGLSSMSPQLSSKRVELLKATLPQASRVAVLWDAGGAFTLSRLAETQSAAQVLGLRVQSLVVSGPQNLESAFEAATREHADALITLHNAVTGSQRARIVELAARTRLPAMYENSDWTDAGGLMAYGANVPAMFRRAAIYVDKILKGANPADLPVEQPMTFEFVVNMRTARALGITFPHEVALQITEVIE